MQRSNFESVPGCSGSEFDQNNDYCYARPSPSHLWLVGDNGVPESAFPLHSCDGDCDSNDECFGDLICFQRGGDEEVPGCIGTNGFARKDFCYDPNPNQTPGPTQSPSTSAPQPTNQPVSPTPPVSHDDTSHEVFIFMQVYVTCHLIPFLPCSHLQLPRLCQLQIHRRTQPLHTQHPSHPRCQQ